MRATEALRPGISVLHVAQPLEAGVPAYVVQLLKDQVQRGLQVAVASPAASTIVPQAARLGAHHVVWEAGREPRPSALGETRRLGAIIDTLRPDILHLHASKAGLAGRLAVRGRRATVFQPHGWSFEAVGGFVRHAALTWERLAARWTDVTICVSEEERRSAESAGIHNLMTVLPSGVDLEAFPFVNAAGRVSARQRLGLGHEPLAVCIGRLSPEKGQDLLLDAWPSVVDRTPQATLVLVGDGPTRLPLEQRRLPSVRLVGERSDVADWLAATDVVVIPSRREGMALVMLEAMATGRSVVSTDVHGAREALGESAGVVVSRDDPAALADAVATRLGDPSLAEREGAAGRALAEESHDVRQMTTAVADVYAWVYE